MGFFFFLLSLIGDTGAPLVTIWQLLTFFFFNNLAAFKNIGMMGLPWWSSG